MHIIYDIGLKDIGGEIIVEFRDKSEPFMYNCVSSVYVIRDVCCIEYEKYNIKHTKIIPLDLITSIDIAE